MSVTLIYAIRTYCGLLDEANMRADMLGNITVKGERFATYHWEDGIPVFKFVDPIHNLRQFQRQPFLLDQFKLESVDFIIRELSRHRIPMLEHLMSLGLGWEFSEYETYFPHFVECIKKENECIRTGSVHPTESQMGLHTKETAGT